MRTVNSYLKDILPPFMIRMGTGLFYGWRGNYSSWEVASRRCTGYDSSSILSKVAESTKKVIAGEAAFERDSVLYSTRDYSYPVVASLLWIALNNGGSLRVLDFGGSLGSTYYQNRYFLNGISGLSWNIVEQPGFVSLGRKEFSDDRLSFYYSIEECTGITEIDVVLLSSVLQYMPCPSDLIDRLIGHGFSHILVDRTPFVGSADRITIQKVPSAIYKASYPCWFFNKSDFLARFEKDYEKICEFDALDRANIRSEFRGFLFRKKTI